MDSARPPGSLPVTLACARCGAEDEFSQTGSVEAWRGASFSLAEDGKTVQINLDRSQCGVDWHTFEFLGYHCARCGAEKSDALKLLERKYPYGTDELGRPLDDRGIAYGPIPEIPGQTRLELAEQPEEMSQ